MSTRRKSREEQKEAELLLLWHKWLYYEKASPEISDFEYDKLEARLRKEFPDSDIIQNAIECPREYWPQFEHRLRTSKR